MFCVLCALEFVITALSVHVFVITALSSGAGSAAHDRGVATTAERGRCVFCVCICVLMFVIAALGLAARSAAHERGAAAAAVCSRGVMGVCQCAYMCAYKVW